MKNMISKFAAKLNTLFGQRQVKQFLSVVLVAFLVLQPTFAATQTNRDASKAATDWVHQNDNSDRPKTTREWNKEARQTEGEPGERLKRIGEESAEAVKDWGSLYPDTAKRTASELRDSTDR
jgi:hypothetical protein